MAILILAAAFLAVTAIILGVSALVELDRRIRRRDRDLEERLRNGLPPSDSPARLRR